MDTNSKRYATSIKVGLLTLTAISILIFTVLWVKGRSLSAGERIELAFQDINGMRAGSAVQMMGLRIGQVEEITPVIQGKDSYVKLRFVITEKGIKIPLASTVSIQQSGIIGEQFLEVTPPKVETVYSPINKSVVEFEHNQPIYMELSTGLKEIGKVEDFEILKTSQLPFEYRQKISTKNTLKLSYFIDLPGLTVDNDLIRYKTDNENKIIFYLEDGEIPAAPKEGLKYTVIEPMRLSDFMNYGFRATKAMLETNDRITEILSDEFIANLKGSVDNIKTLTQSANTTLDKATLLIDSSKAELESLIGHSEGLIKSLTVLADNVNSLVSDENLKQDVMTSLKSVGRMSDNINKILEDQKTNEIISDLQETMRNLNDISTYVNEYTKDEKLKEDITTMVGNLTEITTNVSKVMKDYNSLNDNDKLKLSTTVKDIAVITKNVKKFSEKLNKRFLLFRLMF